MKSLEQELKQMTCLYEISKLIEDPYLSTENILQQVVEKIAACWVQAEISSMRILIDDVEYKPLTHQQFDEIRKYNLSVDGQPTGIIEFSQQDLNQLDELLHDADFFIAELRSQLERFIGQRRIQQALHLYHDHLELQMTETNEELKREIEERTKVEESLKQRNQELSLIARSGNVFNSVLDLDQVLDTVMEEVRSCMEVMGTSVWLVDEETGGLICRHASGKKGKIIQSLRIKPGEGIAGWVLENGKSIIVSDAQQDSRHMTRLKTQLGLEVKSILCAPLISRNKIIGVLQIVDTESDRFDQNQLLLLESLASAAATAIDNAKLYQQACHEIEDRKKIEKKLLASKEKYASILENIEEGYFEINLEGDILFYNEAILKIFDYDDYPSSLMNLQYFLDNDNRAIVFDCLQRVRDTCVAEKCLEFDIISIHGVIKNVETSFSLIKNHKDECIGLRGILRDTTHRRQIEMMARDKAMAESASRAKSQFLACMSHEIRTPLNGIVNMTELIMETELDLYQSNLIKILLNETNTLLTIIEDILDFSKIEAGKLELENVPFSIKQLITEIAASLSTRANQKGIKLEYNLSSQIPDVVCGDPGRIRQIIINLTGNSLKFTHQGAIFINAELIKEWGENIELKFFIKDSGIGIPPEKLDTIFDSFNQIDGSIRRKFGGTGLGTTIARQLVELMQGKIGAESKLGIGSTFWFTIILKKNEDTDFQPVETILPQPDKQFAVEPIISSDKTPADAYESPYRILLVEDAVINQQVAMLHLRKAGYWVHLAENGEEAVNVFQKDYFDMVLMDVEMPVMDGYEATVKIREIEQKRNQEQGFNDAKPVDRIPIIGITAHAFQQCKDKCMEVGMDDYITKPVRRAQLLNIVEKWLPAAPISILYPVKTHQKVLPEKNAPINYHQALEDYMEDEDMLLKVLGQYLNYTGSNIQTLKQAVSNREASVINNIAHKIKGSSANLTIYRIAEIAHEIESAVFPDDFEQCRKLIENLEQEYDRLNRYVDDIYKNRSAAVKD